MECWKLFKKQFQCYEVQRLGMKKPLVAHCATWNDNLLLETRAAFPIAFRGWHGTEWEGHECQATSGQSEHANVISRVPASPTSFVR